MVAIETDKAVVDYELQEEGFVAAILYADGSKDVPLGEILAIIVEDKADIAAFANYDGSSAAPATAPAAAPQEQAASPSPSAAPQQAAADKKSGDRVFASPLAVRMAGEKGLSLSSIAGTGPNGRILAADVEEFKAVAPQAQAAKAPAAGSTKVTAGLPDTSIAYEDLENSQIRKVIAERLTYSKQNIPHYYVTIQVQVDNLLALREKLNKHSTSKISVNDMVIKAASLAATKVP